MKEDTPEALRVLQIFSEEKINEFKELPLKTRVLWLEEANMFINRIVGFKKRAELDRRFEPLAED